MPCRPFRFGLVADRAATPRDLSETARRAEAAGISTLLLRDHLNDDPFGPQLAPLASLAALATATTTLRLGTLVLANDFRHPAVLAKELLTLDAFSGGRLEVGLGAGWLTEEYQRSGIPFDPAPARIRRLAESLTVLDGLLRGEAVTFRGVHYEIDALSLFPEPVQRPRPPLVLGGGARRMLTLAGARADVVNVMSSSVGTGTIDHGPAGRSFAAVAERVGWVRDGAGDRFAEIELSLFPDIVLTDAAPEDAARDLARRDGWHGCSAADVLDMPSLLIGSHDAVADRLRHLRERLGFSYIVVGEADFAEVVPLVAMLAGT